VEAVREEQVKLRGGVGFVKEASFKPGVKERDVQSGESEDEEVMGEGIGE